LTRALENSAERLILVEGDPGSGKSVALRHVAYRMSEAAANCRHFDTKLPVFVNLKEIKRYPDKLIDRILIQELVLESLNRINDHFVDEFLSVEFDNGVKNGLFVFFFDSFDEIPEILSSTQTDDVIEKYNSAISDFLGGMNECRGVIASRSYKGPERQGWKTFRVLELSSARQQVLARRALALKPELVPKLLGQLSLAQEDVRAMARNPMLLGLLCEHMRLGNEFPSQATVLLEDANENDAQARLADIIAGNDAPEGMRWPPGILHILGILQVGFGNRAAAIPDIIRTLSAKLLNSAVQHGDLLDRKFALEVAGTAPQNVLLELIRSSLAIDSQWLNDVVYIQMARLSEIPNDIRTWIRGAILRWALTGQLARNWYGVRAHLMRLQGASDLIQAARLALWIFPLDLAASAALVVGLTLRMSDPSSVNNEFMYLFSAAIATVFLVKMYWAFWGMLAIIARIYVIGIMAFGFAIFSIVDAPWNWSDLAHLSGLVFITIGLLYLGFWGPAAARCVKAGLFTHFRWWPLVPLVYLNDAYEGMRRIIPLILTDLKKTVRHTLTAILLIAFYIALMFGMEHYVPEIADAMRYLVFGVFVFMFLIPLCYTCTLFIKDYLSKII